MAEPPIVDFDQHDREFHQDRHAEWGRLRSCPVAYNRRYDGFWVVSGYDEVMTVARDPITFSHRYEAEPVDDLDYLGILGLPKFDRVLGVGLAEVPEALHPKLRRALNPFMTPTAVTAMQPSIERSVTWFLDQVIEHGRADFVSDLTSPVAALVTMDLVGLPRTEWQYYAEIFQASRGYEPGSDEAARARNTMEAMAGTLLQEMADRRREPRDDVLTTLVEFELDDGQTMSDDQVIGQMWFLIGGGLDTTSTTTILALEHLATHPDLRRRLIDEPELIPSACEEYLRYFAVNETLTRTVTSDVELGGQQLRRGDHLMISWLSANRDESAFDNADEVVLDRAPNAHLTFGSGSHRCIGMHVARAMFQTVLRAVLDRLPDYEIDEPGMRRAPPNPTIESVASLPVRFTPGSATGSSERPY